ncbi:hypothetical protein GYMLUDRAFT_235113 [Collybiopsis luxurians FD-317 M1]|nr:hypothetical protein GYMLUDRAFT_235113 [Collybiopsis luxurians FD-317 M1]
MSYYHHGGPFQQDTNLSSTSTPTEHPSWETLDPSQQHHQDSPSDSHNSAFVSPAAPTPHALPGQQIDFELGTPIEYGSENPDLPFQPHPSSIMNFPPQERLVHSEGYPSPETEFFQPTPSPTTPTAIGLPRTTRSRTTTSVSGGRTTVARGKVHHPYARPQSALAGKSAENYSGARYNVTSAGGMQSYPASMSAPDPGPSYASSSSTMLPQSRPQVATIPIASPSTTAPPTSSHQSMGPPPQPSQLSQQPDQPQLTRLRSTTLPPPSAAPSIGFEHGVRQIRAISKHFFTPRLDCFYNRATHILMAYFELPGVKRENIHISIANSSIPKHKHVNIWGFSLSPNWVLTGAPGTEGASSMTGTTMLTSSGSLSSSSSHIASTPASAVPQSIEAAGTAHTSPASRIGGSAGGADSRQPMLTPAMTASLGYDIPPLYSSRERKYGEFFRLLPVPPETRATDVRAKLEEGVLILSIDCGEPLTEEQVNASREVVHIS